MALREYLELLERHGELHRTRVPIDPALELTAVSVRALREGKPALLIERPANAHFPVVVNHFAAARRIELALGRHPDEIGGELIGFLEQAIPPTFRTLLDHKPVLRRIFHARPARTASALSQQITTFPDLDGLPVQVCWPGDGGRFITYGQVVTYDPRPPGRRNIGIYRMHVFDRNTTGMHWQIQKGGGFHYYQAEKLGRPFELAVALGTSPAMLLATVAALPEGIDEALFAGFLQNRRVEFSRGASVAIDVPADAEFILEGVVPAAERRLEGPFGDHFGHYSAAAEFPVFHLSAITHRRNPVYPAIVVGKPPMEDKFLGDATQQILGPLAKLLHKEITDLWAYYEAGFHNFLVVAIEQRYQKEAMKAALGLMGTDQLSLTKCLVTVSSGVDVRDFHAVLRAVRENFDPHYDFVMIPKVPLDTLDFTSYRMNLGSKMIIDATKKPRPAAAREDRQDDDGALGRMLRELDRRILDAHAVLGTLLLVKVDTLLANVPGEPAAETSWTRRLLEVLVAHPALASFTLIALVSPDVDIQDKESYIWGVFTRFDAERDVVFAESRLVGIAPVYGGVMGIDATWKPGYPEPLTMPEAVTRRVDALWGDIWS
jgi:4-hydroxy-3-polyprenylbenzoate decarboxylase